jgi:O-antigen ligase
LIIALVLQRWLSPRAVGVTIVLSLIAAVLVKSFGGDDAVMAGLAAMFGNTENDLGTITYRRDLLDATLALIKQSPWMGVPNFETALASFRQGEGIIDIVNSYLAIMLNAGIPGCVLYLVPYVLVVAKMLGVHGKERGSSRAVSGSFAPVFVALILTVLFIIFTVASIGVIPYVLVLAVAFPVAWLRQARHEVHPSEVPLSGRPLRHGLSRGWVDASGLMRR